MKKIALAIILFVSGYSFVYPEHSTIAAETTEMYVNAKGDIILRAEPKQNAEQLGKIKNHSKVIVFSSTNGWSYVQSGEVKGYVYTVTLTTKKPKTTNANNASTTVTSGLTPKEGLTLTYKPSFFEDKAETFTVEKDGEYTYLYNKENPNYPYIPNFTYIEDKECIIFGVAESDVLYINAVYPLKQGNYTKDYAHHEERKVLVESTTKTVKIKAGTFNNVVIFRFPDGSRGYFVKEIGIIKITNSKGEITTELASVKE